MLREVTLGQYYVADSKLHKMDPRVKLLATMFYITSVFVVKGIAGYAFIALVLAVLIAISKVPFKFIVRGLKAVVIILILSAVCNVFFFKGTHILVEWSFIKITMEGIEQAVCMAIRLVLLILGTSILTLTTTPNDLTDGLESGLSFLNRVHVPVHEIALMMSISLRFIPILVEETNKIMKAQLSRGADFESGSIIKRIKNYVPIIVPLFVSAFRRAGDLAMAMEARCYRPGAKRTKMHPLKYVKADFIGYCISALYLLLIVVVKLVLCINGLNGFLLM